MRQLPANATTEKNKELGTEPLNILEVEWVDGTKTVYADRDLHYTNDGITAEGKIISLSNLDEIMNVKGTSKNSSFSVTLDDSTDFIKNLIDNNDLHKRDCTLKQHFYGLDGSDAFTLFKGKVNSPISWDLANKQISFTVISDVESNEVGFAPEEGQFASVPSNLVGQPWPLCFGSPIHVPATKYDETAKTQILNNAFISDYSLEHKRALLTLEIERLKENYDYYLEVIDLLNNSVDDPKDIQDDYVDSILDISANEQLVEDLSLAVSKIDTQLNEAKRKYDNSTNAATTATYRAILKKLLANKKHYAAELADKKRLLLDAKAKKDTQKFKLKQSKFIFKTVGRIRGLLYEVTDEVFDVERQLIDIEVAILDEATVVTDKIYLQDIEGFPQGIITIDLQGVLIKGELVGNEFTMHTVVSNYDPVTTVNSNLAGPDYFYLPDETKNFTGLNVLVNDQYVVNVSRQEGRKCYFDAIELPDLDIFKDAELDYSDVSQGDIKTGLNDYLDGTENSQILQLRANEIPQDLAPPVWNKLWGDTNNTQTIRMTNRTNVSGGTWTLFYMGVETDPLPHNATAQQIEDALVGLITKTTASLEKLERMALTFNRTRGFSVSGGPIDWRSVTVTFPTLSQGSGNFTLYMHPLLPNSSALTTSNPNRPIGLVTHGAEDTGAHQFTIKKREKIEEDALKNSSHLSEEYIAIRNAMEATFKKIKAAPNGAAGAWATMVRLMSQMLRLAQDKRMPESTEDDAYRAISQADEDKLLALEVLNYLDWRRSITPIISQTIEEERAGRYYIQGNQITNILESSPILMDGWMVGFNNLDLYERSKRIYALPSGGLQSFPMGTEVKLQGDYQEKFVANILPSTVLGVYAYRSINGIRTLVPVPSSYYVKNESEDFGLFNATTIKLTKPLSEFFGEEWEDQIYVTLTSSVGPNFAEICQHIVETYTNLNVDATTFNSVNTDVDMYPCNFALLSKRDALTLLQDICWQARCAFWTDYGNAYLRYLPANPTSVSTITESDIESGSSVLTFTQTEDIITKTVGEWRTNYAQEELNKTIVRMNVAKYGEVESVKEIFIYNNKELIERTVTYWALQYGNSWKMVDMTLFMNNIQVQTMDCVTLNLPHNHYSNSPIKATVEKADFDTLNFRIGVTLRLPVIFGDMEEFAWAWPQDVTTTYPSDELVVTGNAGSNINFGNSDQALQPTTRPNKLNDILIVPDDFGVSDLSDSSVTSQDLLATQFTVDPNYTSKIFSNKKSLAEQRKEREEKKKKMKEKAQEKIVQNKEGQDFVDQGETELADTEGTDQVKKFQPFIGRVVGANTDQTTTVVDGDDAPEESGEQVSRKYYDIEKSDGTVVTAFILDIHPEETVQQGHAVYVLFDEHYNEWNFQPPVFYGPHLDVEGLS